MRIVDFRTFPDRSELRSQLVDAFEELDLGDGERTDPIADDAPIGVGFPGDLSDDEVRERAEELVSQVSAAAGDELTVRFTLADGESVDDEGSPELLD